MATIFEKMCSDEYKAKLKQRLDEKLFGVLDSEKEEMLNYIYGEQFEEDMRRLKAHDWHIKPPRQVKIRKAHSNRRRTVYVFDGNDGILLRYMTFVLLDFDDIHADGLCSFRKGNRTATFFHKVHEVDPHREMYVAKVDFHDFGNSLDQDIVVEMIEPFFRDDPDFFAFVKWIMTRNLYYRHGELVNERVSIIQGLPIGNFLAGMYLRDMDFELQGKVKLYMRYMDDVACFVETEEEAKAMLKIIFDYAEKRHLIINEDKTDIIRPGEEVEVLGIQIFDGGFDIGDNALRKLMDKVTHYSEKKAHRASYGKITYQTAMKDMLRFYNKLFFGRLSREHELNWVVHAFPMITRIDGLKKIDHCAQEAIRFAGTGKRTNAKYRVRYKDMCAAGYRSLVHAYYHGYEVIDDSTKEMKSCARHPWQV